MKRLSACSIRIVLGLLAVATLAACQPANLPAMLTPQAPLSAGAAPSATPALAEVTAPTPALGEVTTPQAPDAVPAVVPTEDLIAQVMAAAPKDAFGGFVAMPLIVAGGSRPLWAVLSTGRRNFDIQPLPSHFIAIYTHSDAGWQELARLDLDGDAIAPDFVDERFSKQVDLDPGRLFFEIQGAAGAHGGTYQLVSFDGSALHVEATLASPSPGMGSTRDVNDDGKLEVVLDLSDPYIFCYACGAIKVKFQVLRWDAPQGKLVEVALGPLPAGQPQSVSEPAGRAIKLAQGGLWKDSYAAIKEAKAAAGVNAPDALGWDYALIKLHAEALAATLNIEWPLIQQVFYGDYAAAVDILRAYKPEEIWTPKSPLITNPMVEPFVDSLSQNLVESATQALAAEPELAAAYFIRGWGEYLADPASAQARADVAQAARLAPDDALYAGSVAALHP